MANFGRAFPIRGVTINRLVAAGGPTTLTPSLVVDNDIFFVTTAAPGAVTLMPLLFTDSDVFYVPTTTSSYTVTPSFYDDSSNDTSYHPTVTPGVVTLVPSLFADSDIFYVPTVASGAVTLSPSLFTDVDIFYASSAASAIDLVSLLFVDMDTFYSPALGSTDAVQPGLFDDSANDLFYHSSVIGSTTLAPSLFVDADNVFSCSCSETESLVTSLVSDNDTFYSPTFVTSDTLAPSLFIDPDTFYLASTNNNATIGTFVPFIDVDVFYRPSIASARFIQPSLFTDTDVIRAVRESSAMLPSYFVDFDNYFSAILTEGPITMHPSLFVDSDIFWSAFVANQSTQGGGGGGKGGGLKGNVKYSTKVVMQNAGLINAVAITLAAGGSINSVVGIYGDTGAGTPGPLLAQSANHSSVVNSVNQYNLITPLSVLAGQVIWIAVLTDANISWFLITNQSGSRFNNNKFTNGLSNPFGTPSIDNNEAPFVVLYFASANVTLLPGAVVDTDQAYPPAVAPGPALVAASLVVDPDFAYQVVLSGNYAVLPDGLQDTDAIYTPALFPGPANMAPGLFADAEAVYQPSAGATGGLFPATLVDVDVIYGPVLSEPVAGFEPASFDDSANDAFYAPALTGENDATSAGVDNDDAIYLPTVSLGAATLAPDLFVDDEQFGAPVATYTTFDQDLHPDIVIDIFEIILTSTTGLGIDQRMSPQNVVDLDRIFATGKHGRRHEILMDGNRAIDGVLGNSSGDQQVSGDGDRTLELEGEY